MEEVGFELYVNCSAGNLLGQKWNVLLSRKPGWHINRPCQNDPRPMMQMKWWRKL